VSELTPITSDTPWLRLKVGPEDLAGEDPALLARLLEQLLLIRAFEEKILELHGLGLIHGPAHASIGQEAGAVGAMSVLRTVDKINGTHRAHHQILAKLLNAAAPAGYAALLEDLKARIRSTYSSALMAPPHAQLSLPMPRYLIR
jgi:2-oxoisovalerate dehydrogenase E1 component